MKNFLRIAITVILLSFFVVTAMAAPTLSDAELISGDADGDGEITIRDAARILQYLAGWDVTLGGDNPAIEPVDKAVAYIVEFIPAQEGEEDLVEIYSVELGSIEVLASEFDITADTPKISYLGLPFEVYLDVDASDFTQNLYNRGLANILYTVAAEYEEVFNLGNGNIKVVESDNDLNKSYLYLDGTKFERGKHLFNFYIFDNENGWILESNLKLDDLPIYYIFEYNDISAEYVNTYNTYAQIYYRDTDTLIYDETIEDYRSVVDILYTPLSFGQYNVRTLKDRANASRLTDFTTIATWSGNVVENFDEEMSYFKETILGSNAQVTSSTTSVSAKNGEKAKNVTLAGEAVEAGDFVFYAYNGLDNIFTVAKNCGTFETGRLTAYNAANKTVKITGTNYSFGFKNPAGTAMPSEWDDYYANIRDDYIEQLEAGKDNVKYLTVDGNIVYMEPMQYVVTEPTYDFAIMSFDPEIVSSVLGISDAAYNANLSGTVYGIMPGVYVADNGYAAVAVLSKTTGEWELGYIKSVEMDYDYYEDEFTKSADIATLATYTDFFVDPVEYNKFDLYLEAWYTLSSDILLAVVEEDDGAYTVAQSVYSYILTDDDGNYIDEVGSPSDIPILTIGSFFVTGDFADGWFIGDNEGVECNGIIFSDSNAKTNAITADNYVDAERIVIDDETVIIVVDAVNGAVGARVGIQGADNSYETNDGYFLAASSDLIVLVDTEGSRTDIIDWASAPAFDPDNIPEEEPPIEEPSETNETWYVATVNTGVELENVSEDDNAVYLITFTNVFDMMTLEVIDAITYETDDIRDDLLYFGERYSVLHKNDDLLEVEQSMTFAEVIACVSELNSAIIRFVPVLANSIDFIDDNTIEIPAIEDASYMPQGYKQSGEAVDINVTVVTNNKVADAEDYDFGAAVLNKIYTATDATTNDIWDVGSSLIYFGDKNNKVDYWSYPIDGEMVDEICEPTYGILDNYILAKDGATILVPEDDNDDYSDSIQCVVDIDIAAGYKNGAVYLTVYKTISEK